MEGPPGADVGLLHQVLGVVHRPEHPVAVSGQLPAQGLDQVEEDVVVGREAHLEKVPPRPMIRSP